MKMPHAGQKVELSKKRQVSSIKKVLLVGHLDDDNIDPRALSMDR